MNTVLLYHISKGLFCLGLGLTSARGYISRQFWYQLDTAIKFHSTLTLFDILSSCNKIRESAAGDGPDCGCITIHAAFYHLQGTLKSTSITIFLPGTPYDAAIRPLQQTSSPILQTSTASFSKQNFSTFTALIDNHTVHNTTRLPSNHVGGTCFWSRITWREGRKERWKKRQK